MDETPLHFYDRNGNLIREEWLSNGVFHRDGDKPAIIDYENSRVIGEIWYVNGHIHRDNDKPAVVIYNRDGRSIYTREWWMYGNLYREMNKPITIIYNPNGTILEEFYSQDNRKRSRGEYDDEHRRIRSSSSI